MWTMILSAKQSDDLNVVKRVVCSCLSIILWHREPIFHRWSPRFYIFICFLSLPFTRTFVRVWAFEMQFSPNRIIVWIIKTFIIIALKNGQNDVCVCGSHGRLLNFICSFLAHFFVPLSSCSRLKMTTIFFILCERSVVVKQLSVHDASEICILFLRSTKYRCRNKN